MRFRKLKLQFYNDWRFETLQDMTPNDTYIFTTDCGITIFVEHDCNLDKNMTYGWSISVFDKDMNDLDCFGIGTLDELASGFNNITHQIEAYFDEPRKELTTLEDILQKLTNSNAPMFNKNGGFTEKGGVAYDKLVSIVYGLGNICNGKLDANTVVDELDKITNEHY